MILVLHSTVAGSDEWMVLGGVGGPNWKRSVRRRLRIVFRTFLCSLEVRLARYRAPREPQYKIYGDPVKRQAYQVRHHGTNVIPTDFSSRSSRWWALPPPITMMLSNQRPRIEASSSLPYLLSVNNTCPELASIYSNHEIQRCFLGISCSGHFCLYHAGTSSVLRSSDTFRSFTDGVDDLNISLLLNKSCRRTPPK